MSFQKISKDFKSTSSKEAVCGSSDMEKPTEGVAGVAARSFLPWYVWLLVFGLDIIGPMSSDIYAAALRHVAEDLHASQSLTNMSMYFNWVANAFSCLTIGILADRYGRRKVIFASLFIYFAGATMASFAKDVLTLIVARLLMGCGQGSQMLAQVIARDLFDDQATRVRVMAFLGAAAQLAIMAAPVLGGVITQYLGWQWIFRFLAAWAFALFLGSSMMKETKPKTEPSEGVLVLQKKREALKRLLTSRSYVGFVGFTAFLQAGIGAMITSVPQVLQQQPYGLSETWSAGVLSLMPICGLLGSATVTLLLKVFRPINVARVGMVPYTINTALACCLVALPSIDAWWLLVLPCFLAVWIHFVFTPTAQSLYLQSFRICWNGRRSCWTFPDLHDGAWSCLDSNRP